ncbi:hypothetical protein PoB_000502100 [Plakobranchus ocellatus]|uniref:VWFC domain-containing protein n=1 Tax=Plakobranchus ocellatus TaxID=259542 RepID=A0AAV3XTP3_9GAST|nr:hypothetical protein PoB_000502100 [Plakobranchus ocellatus]
MLTLQLSMMYSTIAVVILAEAMLSIAAAPAEGRQIGRFVVGQYTRGGCEIQGLYPHDIMSFDSSEITRRYRLGEQWTERCNNCTCTTAGVMCEGPTDCLHSYDFTQEKWCLEWSADECCCERMGCTVNGEQYDIGERFPYEGGASCLTCSCQIGTTPAQCLLQECGIVELICENRSVTYEDGNCCPNFVCPQGVKCTNIPDPFPNTSNHELLDWYGRLNPIPQGMNQHYHLDSWTSYVCSCPRGGTAECEMRTFGM